MNNELYLQIAKEYIPESVLKRESFNLLQLCAAIEKEVEKRVREEYSTQGIQCAVCGQFSDFLYVDAEAIRGGVK